MEVEIENGTIEIDIDEIVNEVINSGQLSDDVNMLVQDNIDFDEIRYNIEDDILSQVTDYIDTDDIRYEIEEDILRQVPDYMDLEHISDHVDFFYNTHNLDFDEIRENIEGDLMDSVTEYLDYDRIIQEVNRRQIPELMQKIRVLENEISSLKIIQNSQHEVMVDLMSSVKELEMSVWSRIVRYVRSWF